MGGHTESLTADNVKYNPTVGVRIVEFDYKSEAIEIWDSSGDHSYESCWAAIMNDADAVLLVYNPEAAGQDQQLGDWYEYFVKRNGLRDEQCLIFAHRQTQNSESRFRPRKLEHNRCILFNLNNVLINFCSYSFSESDSGINYVSKWTGH